MMYTSNFVAAVQIDGKTMREFGNQGSSDIFLPFGSDYSLYLKNLNTERAVVSISIDGEDVLDGSQIVVNANSSTELEGFMNGSTVRNKFRFIEKSDKIREHRGEQPEDGLIRIEFQFEEPVPSFRSIVRDSTKGIGPSNVEFFGTINNVSSQSLSKPTENDEGITVAGKETRQDFQTTYIGRLNPQKHVIVFHLRGETNDNKAIRKPVKAREKVRCKICGTKSKSSARFCGECSAALV